MDGAEPTCKRDETGTSAQVVPVGTGEGRRALLFRSAHNFLSMWHKFPLAIRRVKLIERRTALVESYLTRK